MQEKENEEMHLLEEVEGLRRDLTRTSRKERQMDPAARREEYLLPL